MLYIIFFWRQVMRYHCEFLDLVHDQKVKKLQCFQPNCYQSILLKA